MTEALRPTQRHLVESLCAEIAARSHVIEIRARELLSEHFISRAPERLAETIIAAAAYVTQASQDMLREMDWDDEDTLTQDLRQLQIANQAILTLPPQQNLWAC